MGILMREPSIGETLSRYLRRCEQEQAVREREQATAWEHIARAVSRGTTRALSFVAWRGSLQDAVRLQTRVLLSGVRW